MNYYVTEQNQRSAPAGFAMIATLAVMVLLIMVALAMLSLSALEVRASKHEDAMHVARANARMALMLAIGDLQKYAGPDQRVTASADILAGREAVVDGRAHWTGVWDTTHYDPSDPATKPFVSWLISSADPVMNSTLSSVSSAASGDQILIYQGADDVSSVRVPKVALSGRGNGQYYAYWIEDEGVKADLAWSEGTYADAKRGQSARMSSSPGLDYEVFAGPFAGKVEHPITRGSPDWLHDNLEKALSPADMPLVVGDPSARRAWLRSIRHDVTLASMGVMADVKNGGLRRDLSLAFEMDGSSESMDAALFNQQGGEFVAGTDHYSAIQNAPGMTIKDRYLFRDFAGAGQPFSDHIGSPETVVRGPSWWLMRDYANLYKRLKTFGSGYAMSARAYYPNRTAAKPSNNLFDIHAQKNRGFSNPDMVYVTNREKNSHGLYAFRPVQASYAPVLLGVNAIYSLVYTGDRLQMVVDPFFIIWNPYDIQITAEKFAVTLQNGLAGGVQFKVTDPDGNAKIHGKPARRWRDKGTDTCFADYAIRKSGVNANLSYLITDLNMGPGEVLIYSPPEESDRSGDANVLNDELVPGMNYDATTSGIFFNEFPDHTGGAWAPIVVDRQKSQQYKIEVMFNILSQDSYAIKNYIETNLPSSERKANELTTEANFGDHVAGKEFRLNLGGSQFARNMDRGTRGYSHSYAFSELGATKKSFGILSMLTIPTDYGEADTAMEVYSQLNVTPVVCANTEVFSYAPFNIVVKTVPAEGINNLMNEVGIDLDAIGSGNNGFYGKSYDMADGDSSFPLLGIPKAPMHSLVQLAGANTGTRLLEPTHAIGNSWRPPYIPRHSIYDNNSSLMPSNWKINLTMHDVSWLINDALFDRYYLSGIAPSYTIGSSGYSMNASSASSGIRDALQHLYGDNPRQAKVNPALAPYIPAGMTSSEIADLLAQQDGYKKLGAYSFIKGAFNVNSTSVNAWRALLQANKDLAIESLQGTNDSASGTPFPLSSFISDTGSNNGWEKFSRLSDDDISNLAARIVDEVRTRGPFMSISDFVNRRIGNDNSASRGALQEAIEQAGINRVIRGNTSDMTANYGDYSFVFSHADTETDARNNATGVPLEINQANILLPLAPRLTARSDTFNIRAYGEADSSSGGVVRAYCEATVQRVPEYTNTVDAPWKENYQNPVSLVGTPQLAPLNQRFGRSFKMVSFRWLNNSEI